MANWSNPQLTSTYTNFVTEVKDRDVDLAKQFDGQTVTNLVTGAIRWDSTANRWKKWTGSAWGELTATYALTNISATGTGTFGGSLDVSGNVVATDNVQGKQFLVSGVTTAPANGVFLPATNHVAFATDSNQRITIAPDGDVGIATANPSVKLDVIGGIKAKGGSSGDAGYTFNSEDTDGGLFSPADDEIFLATNGTRRITCKGASVGIGDATSPTGHLHIHQGNSSQAEFRISNSEGTAKILADGGAVWTDADSHNFRTAAGSNLVKIDSTGRLIVGASSASHKLHVQGTARFTGAVEFNAGITSSVTGNASTATDLAINAGNRLLYQSGNNATDVLAAGNSGDVLQSNGSSAPSWVSGAFVPTGGIIIWSGAQNAIPSGWTLCNGSNSTPDLRDRFVVGAGSAYSVNNTGGSANAVVVSHTHTTSSAGSHGHGVSDPGHTHSYHGHSNTTCGGGDSCSQSAWWGGMTKTSGSQTTGISINSGGSHSHSVNSSGESGTNKNLPPYYALCYIMKT